MCLDDVESTRLRLNTLCECYCSWIDRAEENFSKAALASFVRLLSTLLDVPLTSFPPPRRQRMADVFRVHDGTTNGSPIASTSYSTLDDNEGVVNSGGAGPSLAQLLQETVRESARRGSRSAGSSSSHGTLKGRNDASLNNKLDNHAPLPSLPSLSSPSSRAYISSLLSKDLAALLKEPEELSRQSDLLDGDLATLCFKSIGDLLGVGDCVDSVEDGFG